MPIRSESRCLCGHRLKEHDKPSSTGACRWGYCQHQCSHEYTLLFDHKPLQCQALVAAFAMHIDIQYTGTNSSAVRPNAASPSDAGATMPNVPANPSSFIPAEGSWILKCRCKHRHTDHDPVSHSCCKSSCNCNIFHSPWVCNCNHAWSQHQQVRYTLINNVKHLRVDEELFVALLHARQAMTAWTC